MNPFVNLPLFLSLTADQEPTQQRRTAWCTTLFSALMCAVVAVSGSALLRFFGISIDDFRVAGGLVLLTIALGMLSERDSNAHEGSKTKKAHAADYAAANDVAFYPMTFPIIVGPGTITTIIVLFTQAGGAKGIAAVVLALVLVLGALGAVLHFSSTIGRHMSLTLRTIMTRLMGMILAAIAVSMLAAGLSRLFPGLSG